MLDKQGFKLLSVLKDDPRFARLNWFIFFRLKTTMEKFYNWNPGLNLTLKGVTLLSDKTGKTPLDFASCASESFKRIQKGSSYYRRILLFHKPRGTTTWKKGLE